MKATDLNRALNYVDDAYLMEADTPYKVIETESKEIKPMKTQKRAFRILLAAALIGVLSITAYAAEMLPIHKLESGKTKHYESYSDVDRAIAQVGLEVSVPEEFENGFRFQGVDVGHFLGGLEHMAANQIDFEFLQIHFFTFQFCKCKRWC